MPPRHAAAGPPRYTALASHMSRCGTAAQSVVVAPYPKETVGCRNHMNWRDSGLRLQVTDGTCVT
jgi:hypothetical protein